MANNRITRSQSVSDLPNSQNNMLAEISSKLTIVCDSLSKVTDQLSHLNNTMDNMSKDMQQDASLRDIANTFQGSVNTMQNKICQEVHSLSEEINKLSSTQTEDLDTITVDTQNDVQESDAQKEQKKIADWNNQLNERKMLYWDSLRCHNTAKQYKEWLHQDPKFIPRKYVSRSYEGELKEEKEARRKLAIFKMETEIKVLETRHAHYREQYQQIDLIMHQKFEDLQPKTLSDEVSALWIAAYTNEEDISHDRWTNTKKKFLDSLPQSEQEYQSNETRRPRYKKHGYRNAQNQRKPAFNTTNHQTNHPSTSGSQGQDYSTKLNNGNIQRTIHNNSHRNPFLGLNPHHKGPR